MKILLLCHSFNSLTQRCFVELRERGHDVSVEIDASPALTAEAVELFQPDLVVAPFLKRLIPENVWRRVPCLVVHPGIPGDGGPAALDWAILDGEPDWGVTVLEADGGFDAGPVWAAQGFPARRASKASLYRHEVSDAAMSCLHLCIGYYDKHCCRPPAILGEVPARRGTWRGLVPRDLRMVDFAKMTADDILRRMRASEGQPGVRVEMDGCSFKLFDAMPAPGLHGKPGTVLAQCGGFVALAAADAALWIGHVQAFAPSSIKLPAARLLPVPLSVPNLAQDDALAPQRISTTWHDSVAVLHFAFYNGAMGVAECRELLSAYRKLVACKPRVIVLAGGPDHWSNGMDLNCIEAANSPADESWANINAIDDLAEEIIRTEGVITVSALAGNAGAGGVFLARAADRLWLRRGVILSPHYKDMGNLHGSEFWSYLLPRHCGADAAAKIMAARLPMGADEAVRLGLADAAYDAASFDADILAAARLLADDASFFTAVAEKREARTRDEAQKPLHSYREEELARMRRCFYGSDPSYHVARHHFVHKIPKSRTPLTIARHRRILPVRRLEVLA